MSGSGSGASVEISGIAKTFRGGVRALLPTSLAISRSETVVLLGPSGCGKTTLLRIIAGLERADPGGLVRFDGQDVTEVPIEKRDVGMVFQSYALFPNMTVAQNVSYGLKLRRLPVAERRRRVGEMLALTGIEGLAERSVEQLSGGQRQRVALARAVVVRPRVLLLDEPLTALDAALRERLRSELNSLLRQLGITAVYVTHDQSEAMALGDRIVVMKQGAVVQVGTPRDIYFRPATRFVAEFIGAANIVSGDVSHGQLMLPGGRIRVELPAGPATVMLRPEAIELVPPSTAAWRGRVTSVAFLGDRQRVSVVDAAQAPIFVEAGNGVRVGIGDTVGLAIVPSTIVGVPDEKVQS